MSNIRLLLLGAPELWLNNQLIELKSAKAMALLAYLAVTGTPQTRDHVTDLLWPDSLPDAARKNLRNTLWAIRKQTNEDILGAGGDWMALADVAVDLREFEQAQQTPKTGPLLANALNLYRGPLLEGLTVTDAPDFELWLATERERVGQLYLRLLEAMIDVQRQAGDWRGMQSSARRALAADNLQEPMHRALMEAFARQGERAEALRQYDALAEILLQELGVEPLPETQRLRAEILAGTLGQPPAASMPAVSTSPPRPPRKRGGAPFVGRQAELDALSEQFQLAVAGQARVALITGELGIGKTRLWQEWSASLPESVTVLEARCLNTTQLLPFAPLTGLFDHNKCISRVIQSNPAPSSIWLAELSRLLPEIRQRVPDLPQPPSLPPEEEHRRLYEAFIWVLRTLNGQPLVLFVDDLHWIDQSTLDWLVFLVDRMQNEPLLLVATYRPSDASPQLSQATAGWSRTGIVRRLPLGRFSLEETTALLSALGRDVAHVEPLQQKSAGNPYFLIELSQDQANGTPPELAELIRARLNRLPEAARQVLQAAAVLDNNFDFSTLRQTSGRGEEETINALDDLLEHNLLTENSKSYEFGHPLVAQVVRSDLSLARRSFLHRRAAQALEATSGDRLDTIAGQLAHHYAQAGQPGKAAHFAQMAASRALKLSALTEAIGFFQQAVTLEPTPARRFGLGEALIGQGQLEEGRRLLQTAAAEFEQAGDSQGVVQAYLSLALSFLASGQGKEVIHWAEQARARLGTIDDPAVLARVYHTLAAGGMLLGQPLAQVEKNLQAGIRLATKHNLPDMAGICRFELGNVLAHRGDLAGAVSSFRAALELSEAAGSVMQAPVARNNLAYHLILLNQLPEARHHIEAALELAEKHALFSPRQYLYSTRGELALAEGGLDEATEWFERALAEAERNHNQPQAANIRANLGLAARARGELDEALLLLEAARSAVASLTLPHLQTQIDLWLAELYTERGELAAARNSLAAAKKRLAGSERHGLQAWAEQVEQRLNG